MSRSMPRLFKTCHYAGCEEISRTYASEICDKHYKREQYRAKVAPLAKRKHHCTQCDEPGHNVRSHR